MNGGRPRRTARNPRIGARVHERHPVTGFVRAAGGACPGGEAGAGWLIFPFGE